MSGRRGLTIFLATVATIVAVLPPPRGLGHAIRDRGALSDLRRSQEPTVQESIRLRQQLETLAAKTAQFAADGDEGAKSVVDQMKRQGVTLTPPKQ